MDFKRQTQSKGLIPVKLKCLLGNTPESEPIVLPARFPNILVNGAGGIAVGMATNIAPHNLGEIIDATLAILEDGDIADEDLLDIVPGPDFPTGGLIMGQSGARSALLTGKGSVIMRAKTHVEEHRKDREAIIVTELPYQVNKAVLIKKIAEMVRDKRIEGITDLRDESDRDGMRIVIEIRKDAVPDVVLNQLFRFSQMQTNFSANMLALNGGKPQQMNLKTMLSAFLNFREDVIARRSKFDLAKARARAHILVGLATAVTNIDEVIKLIRTSANPATSACLTGCSKQLGRKGKSGFILATTSSQCHASLASNPDVSHDFVDLSVSPA